MNEKTDTERYNNLPKVNSWAGIWTQAIWGSESMLLSTTLNHLSQKSITDDFKEKYLIKYYKNTKQ